MGSFKFESIAAKRFRLNIPQNIPSTNYILRYPSISVQVWIARACDSDGTFSCSLCFFSSGWCIPVMPKAMEIYDLLNSPVPFFVGFHSDAMAEDEHVEDVVFFDLDNNSSLFVPYYEAGPQKLPKKFYDKLTNKLRTYGDIYNPKHPSIVNIDKAFPETNGKVEPVKDFAYNSGSTITRVVSSNLEKVIADERDFNEREVREAFLRTVVGLMRDYSGFMSEEPGMHAGMEKMVTFDRPGFLSNKKGDEKEFLESLLDTQSFQMFLQNMNNKSDANTRFFNECIKKKYHGKKTWRCNHSHCPAPFSSLFSYTCFSPRIHPTIDLPSLIHLLPYCPLAFSCLPNITSSFLVSYTPGQCSRNLMFGSPPRRSPSQPKRSSRSRRIRLGCNLGSGSTTSPRGWSPI